ncbi:MAG: ABC transporter substrate-binding protein [Lachnospiraceae bacterium]|nr:ABC transporter substrate-binding protein [Lachnospiraceae bacterium]
MKKLISIFMCLLLTLSCAACGKKAEEPGKETAAQKEESKETVGSQSESKQPGGNVQEDVIKIGVLYPTTGSSSVIGLTCQQACIMAAEIINGSYPDLDMPLAAEEGLPNLNGAKIEVVLGDTQGDPIYGQSEAERMITQEGVVAIVGCFNSSVGLTISQICQQYEVPFINADCASKSLSLNNEGYEWHFRTGFVETATAEGYFDYMDALREKGEEINTLALVYENSEAGITASDSQRELAEKRGYEIVLEVSYPSSTTDVSSEAKKIKAADPDVIIHGTYVSDAILYTEAYKALNYNPKMLLACSGGFTTPQYLEAVNSDGNYYSCLDTWSISLGETKPLVTQVNEIYQSMYGADKMMDGVNARSFNGMITICDAINRAGSTENKAIFDALLETNIDAGKLITAYGIEFDEASHDNKHASLLMTQIFDGEYLVTWPFDSAGADYVYPIPAWSERP